MVKLPVVPPGWVEHHRPVVEGFFRGSAVVLERRNGEALDAWGTSTPVWAAIYAGPGLVQVDSTRPEVTDSAGRVVVVQEYLAMLPHAVTIERGSEHRVRVLTSHDVDSPDVFTVIACETQGWPAYRRLRMVRSSHE